MMRRSGRGIDDEVTGAALAVVDLTGGRPRVREITDPAAFAETADWHPDRDLIVYAALPEPGLATNRVTCLIWVRKPWTMWPVSGRFRTVGGLCRPAPRARRRLRGPPAKEGLRADAGALVQIAGRRIPSSAARRIGSR